MAKTIVVDITYDGVLNQPCSSAFASAYTRLYNQISGDATLSAGRVIMALAGDKFADKFGSESTVTRSDSTHDMYRVLITFAQAVGTPCDADIVTAYNALQAMIAGDSVLSLGHYITSLYDTALYGGESGGDE